MPDITRKNMNLLVDLDEVLVHMRLITDFEVANTTGLVKNVAYTDTQGQTMKVSEAD
jgi:hypothetical protein